MLRIKKSKKFFLEKSINLLKLIKYNFLEIITEYKLIKLIFNKILKKKNIKIKLGIDPSNKFLHLGHFILLNKFNFLKNLNFILILLIGNFTAYIGNNFNKIKKKYYLKNNFIKINIYCFLIQLRIIIKNKKVKIYYNGDWIFFLNIKEFLKFSLNFSINYFLSKKKIKKNIFKKNNIIFLELIYPIFQSYDSFFLISNIEIGGIDQKINFKITNIFLKKNLKNKQINLLNKLLISSDKFNKMSKSFKNFISLNFNIKKIIINFYKIPNVLLKEYFCLLYNKVNYKNDINKFFLKKNLIFYLISKIYNKNFLFIFFFKKINKNKKLIFLKKKFINFYKIYKILNLKKSKNNFKKFLKENKIKINNILIKNFNFLLNKGYYLIKLNNNKLYFIIK